MNGEVARHLRGRKLKANADARITEVWRIDLEAEAIEVYGKPRGGKYHEAQVRRRGQRLTITALPGRTFRVSEILG